MAEMAFVDRWWQSDGLRLHARDYAGAEGAAKLPVVCIHGLTRNARDFDALAPWIAATGRRTLSLDIRGRGFSERDPNADYRLPTYARDVAALFDALGFARAIFVGTSMGGLITMELSAQRPELIAAAVLNDIGPELAREGLVRIGNYTKVKAEIHNWADAAAYLRDQNAHALPHYGDADWDVMARRMFREQDGKVAADYDPAIWTTFGEVGGTDPWNRWDTLASGRPTLVLRGGISDLLDQPTAERMVDGRAQATLAIVDNVGHAPMLDEPDALAAIGTFLEAQP